MTRPEVTIAVPLFNGAMTIRETLESVFAQTFRDFELVVLDDGSRDGCVDLVHAFSDPRLRIERFENRGIAASFNRCIERAHGRYLKVLPQDDLLHPDCLGESLALLQQSRNPALVFSRRGVLCDAADHWTADWMKSHKTVDLALQPLEAVNDGAELLRRWVAGKLTTNYVGEPVATLFPVALARSIGGFSLHLRQKLDYELWMRLMARGDVCFTERELCTFRLHASGTSRENWRRLTFENLLMYEGLASDAELVRILPEVPRLLRKEHKKVFGTPWRRFFFFWKHYRSESDLPARHAAPGRGAVLPGAPEIAGGIDPRARESHEHKR